MFEVCFEMASINSLKNTIRGKSFTEEERCVLFDAAKPHLDIIENKRTDATTVAYKNDAWEKVGKLFNSSTLVHKVSERYNLMLHINVCY